MFAQFTQDNPMTQTTRTPLLTPARIAIAVGLLLGALFSGLWPQLAGLTAVAAWLLGQAIGLLGVGLVTVRRAGPSEWGLVFGGQVLGATAVLLLFLASLG